MTDRHTPWTGLDEALAALRSAATDLTAGDLGRPTPCSVWTVAQVLAHAAGDQLGYAAFQGSGSGPDFDPFAPPAGADPAAVSDLVAAAVTTAEATWAAVDPAGEVVPTPLPQGALAPETAAGAAALDAGVHAWDVAVALGRPSPLTDDLAAWLLPTAHALVEPLRQWGAYAPALPDDGAEGPAAALLRYLGRDPAWTA